MKKNKAFRQLCHELRSGFWPIESINFPENFDNHLLPQVKKWYLKIKDLQTKLQMTNEQVIDLGRTSRQEKFEYRWQYNRKPITVRRDNKDVKVGSGGSNRNKIRYPKKCRKTAWKRFYKLFPHLTAD